MNSQMFNAPNQQNQPQQPLSPELEKLRDAYDKNSPSYAFNYVFYNISPTTMHYRPPNFPPNLWVDVLRRAPTQNHAPVVIQGFDELKVRYAQQLEVIKKLNESWQTIVEDNNRLKIDIERVRFKLRGLVERMRDLYKWLIMTGRISVSNVGASRTLRIGSSNENSAYIDKREEVIAVMKVYRNILLTIRNEIAKMKGTGVN